MTPEQLREAAAVMLAASEGKKIEVRPKDRPSHRWVDVRQLDWNWYDYEYRIKPEPRKVAVRLHYSEWSRRYAAINIGDPVRGEWKPVSDIVEIEVRDE